MDFPLKVYETNSLSKPLLYHKALLRNISLLALSVFVISHLKIANTYIFLPVEEQEGPVDDETCEWSHSARCLTPEEIAKLKKDSTLVTEFKQNKFEKEAQKNWDLFYKRNTTKFFKDRHWTTREFQDLLNEKETQVKIFIYSFIYLLFITFAFCLC